MWVYREYEKSTAGPSSREAGPSWLCGAPLLGGVYLKSDCLLKLVITGILHTQIIIAATNYKVPLEIRFYVNHKIPITNIFWVEHALAPSLLAPNTLILAIMVIRLLRLRRVSLMTSPEVIHFSHGDQESQTPEPGLLPARHTLALSLLASRDGSPSHCYREFPQHLDNLKPHGLLLRGTPRQGVQKEEKEYALSRHRKQQAQTVHHWALGSQHRSYFHLSLWRSSVVLLRTPLPFTKLLSTLSLL